MRYLLFLGTIIVILVIAGTIIWIRRQAGHYKAQMKDAFSALSLDALAKATTEFLKIANETLMKQAQSGEKDLETKKKLIDQTLDAVKNELRNIQKLIKDSDNNSGQKFSALDIQLKTAVDVTGKLHETTNQLRAALASTTARGQWGQRMAEDVLRLAGFIEGINYRKERAQDTVNTRPDYTFLLPQGLKVNMDVKFPMSNYLRYLDAGNEMEKGRYKELFLRDARTRIKEVTNRDYINPEEKTLDYVIAFIPNEQVYAFINEYDRTILDDAMRAKVVLCSPLTLYAILAVIRQAVDSFNLEKTAGRILALLGAFGKQWDAFINSFDKLGNKIRDVQEEFNSLTSTRRNQLERQLKKIEDLREQEKIAEAEIPKEDTSAIENSAEHK